MTIVETLAVIAILGFLFSMFALGINSYRERARLVQCVSNIRGLGAAVQLYATENFGRIPSANEDNSQLMPDGGLGYMDLRLELFVYDSVLWNLSCPRHPNRKHDPNPRMPSYISYDYLFENGGDIFKLKPNQCVIMEGGHFHLDKTAVKGPAYFADGHTEVMEIRN